MKLILFISLIFVSLQLNAQEDTTVYESVDQEAEFPGGHSKLIQWVMDQDIPFEDEFQNGSCSKIYLQFVIEKDGSITNVKSLKTCSLSQKNAVILMQNCPTWTPAIHHSATVRSRMTLPITICLSD